MPPVTAFDSTPGRGVCAGVECSNAHLVQVGSPVLLDHVRCRETASPGADAVAAAIDEAQAAERTAVLVLIDGTPAALLALADQLRGDARAAVAEVGITDVHAELLPADEVACVGQLQKDGRHDPALAGRTSVSRWDATVHLALGTADAAGHEGFTVVVGLNGLRLLHASAWWRAQGPGDTVSYEFA